MSSVWKRERMYLHIGNGKTIKKKQIIGIFDLDTVTVSSAGRTFIQHMEQRGQIFYTDSDLPRSFVLYTEEGTCSIQLSRISAQGLLGRANRAVTECGDI